MKFLPTCENFTIAHHAYVSLDMKLQHILGHGIELSFYEPGGSVNVGFNAYKAMRHMYHKIHTEEDSDLKNWR